MSDKLLSGREKRIVEALAHELMSDYGYAEGPRPRPPLGYRIKKTMERAAARAARTAGRLL